MKNIKKKMGLVGMLLVSVSLNAQTKYLAIKKNIGNYVIADCMQKEPAKIKDQPDKIIYLYTAIFESSDTEGKKPIMKLDQFELVETTSDKLIVKLDGKCGIFDYGKGKMAEPLVNTAIKQFKISKNLLLEGKNVRLMDPNLKLIKSYPFKKTYSYLGEQFYDAAQNGKNAFIYDSYEGNVLHDLGNVKIEDVFQDVFIVEKDKKSGIMDVNKNILIPIQYFGFEFLDYSDDHLRVLDNRKDGSYSGLVKYADGKVTTVIEPNYIFATELPGGIFRGDTICYYRINSNFVGEILDRNLKVILSIFNAEEAVEMEVYNNQYILGRDYSYDYFWVSDETGHKVGKKYSNVDVITDKELKHHTVFTGDRPMHSTIINDVTKKKQEYDDLMYFSFTVNNTMIFETENGRYVYFKRNKEKNDIEPILANSMTGWNNEIMEIPTGYLPIQIAKNIFMVYDTYNDKIISEGDLEKVRRETIKYMMEEMNKEFSVKNLPNPEVSVTVACTTKYNSGAAPTFNYRVNDVQMFGKDSLHHAVNFIRNFYAKDSKITIGTATLLPDYNKYDLFLSAVFDNNYNMILPFQDGQIQAFGKENAGGIPDGYVIYSVYSDSMFVLLPKLNKRIPHKAFYFMKATEEMAGFHLFGDLLFIEDWMKNYCYVMDLSGVVIKKINMGDLEIYDEDYLITYGEKSIVYFFNSRKELLLEGQSAYRITNTNILVMVNEMTDESKLYNIKTGEMVFNGKYENLSVYNKLYGMVSQGEKIAVLHLQEAKLITDFNLTQEQAVEFIEKQKD